MNTGGQSVFEFRWVVQAAVCLPLSAGILLGHRQQPKGGLCAQQAQEEAAVRGEGKAAPQLYT